MSSAKPKVPTERRSGDNDRVDPANWSPDHPNEGDAERWKGSPSTETTSDEGTNEKLDQEHKRDENEPGFPGSRRKITSH